MTRKKPSKIRRKKSTSVKPPRRPAHSPATKQARPSMVQLPRLLTVAEVADTLKTTPKAIYCRISRGAMPGVIRLDGRVLIDASELLSWLEQRRAVSPNTRKENRR